MRGGDEAFVIDSPVFPDELELLPALLEQAGFPFGGLLATHGDWDHLLGRLAFPGAALGVAETTAARLRAHPGAAQRELRDFDERHYLERPAPLALGWWSRCRCPATARSATRELELHPADGHTVDGMAVVIPWAGVLVCGDYLSPVEIPTPAGGGRRLSGDARAPRAAGGAAEHVFPATAGRSTRDTRPARLLAEDRDYLKALATGRGGVSALPDGRRDGEQRRLHERNLASTALSRAALELLASEARRACRRERGRHEREGGGGGEQRPAHRHPEGL